MRGVFSNGGVRGVAMAGVVFVALVWLGLLVGVSFLATPVKFRAGSLDLPTALEVGRVTFGLFVRVEWGALFVLTVAMGLARPGWVFWLGLAVVGGAVWLEGAWLLPVLDERVGVVLGGGELGVSHHHWLYVGVEGLKGLVLAGMGAAGLWRVGKKGSFRS